MVVKKLFQYFTISILQISMVCEFPQLDRNFLLSPVTLNHQVHIIKEQENIYYGRKSKYNAACQILYID